MAAIPTEKNVSKTQAPPVSPSLKLRCKYRVQECVERFNKLGTNLAMPTVSFDLRGKVAGKAYLTQNHVQLNSVLLQENVEDFIHQTIGHEVAHLATFARYGRAVSPHGEEWKKMMRSIGLEPNRCHNFDTSNSSVSKATFRWVCACREYLLTSRRHASAQQRGYRCKKCSTSLQFAPPGQGFQPVGDLSRGMRRTAEKRYPSAGHGGRPPTTPMVEFGSSLARSRGLVLPPAALSSFELMAQFITQAKALPEKKLAIDKPTTGRSFEHAGVLPQDAPTLRQLEYAKALSLRTGVALTTSVTESREALSKWISGALGR